MANVKLVVMLVALQLVSSSRGINQDQPMKDDVSTEENQVQSETEIQDFLNMNNTSEVVTNVESDLDEAYSDYRATVADVSTTDSSFTTRGKDADGVIDRDHDPVYNEVFLESTKKPVRRQPSEVKKSGQKINSGPVGQPTVKNLTPPTHQPVPQTNQDEEVHEKRSSVNQISSGQQDLKDLSDLLPMRNDENRLGHQRRNSQMVENIEIRNNPKETESSTNYQSLLVVLVCLLIGFILFQNRKKIIALVLEGRPLTRNGRVGVRLRSIVTIPKPRYRTLEEENVPGDDQQ